MEARAYLRHVRIAPRKVQIVMDLIRNKPVNEALFCSTHQKLLANLYLNWLNQQWLMRNTTLTWTKTICTLQNVLLHQAQL